MANAVRFVDEYLLGKQNRSSLSCFVLFFILYFNTEIIKCSDLRSVLNIFLYWNSKSLVACVDSSVKNGSR